MKLADLDYAARVALDRLGRVGGLGLALLGGAAFLYFLSVRPAQENFAELQRRLERLEQRGQAGETDPGLGAVSRMEEFMDFFPDLDSAPRWLKKMYSIAENEGLELLQGSYRLSEDAALMLSRYHVSLPVRGTYPQIRRFIAGVLDEVPFASLETVAFQRENAANGTVEANLTLTLHLKAPPKAVPPEQAAQIARVVNAASTDP